MNRLLGIGLLSLLVAAQLPSLARAQDQESFEAKFKSIEKLARRKKWKAARRGIDDLLADNTGQWYVRARRVEIENLTRQVAFRLKYPETSAQDVTQGDLKRFDERSGRFKIVYGEGEWRDFEKAGSFRVFPGLMTGPHTVTLKGSNLSRSLRFLTCANKDQALIIDTGHAQHGDRWTSAEMSISEGKSDKRLDFKEVPAPRLTKPFTFKIKVTKQSVSLSYNGKRQLNGRRPKEGYGYLYLPGAAFDEITIEGAADPAWVQSLVDQADERKRAKFRSSFKVGQELPKWLYDESAAKGPGALTGNANAATPDLRLWPGAPKAAEKNSLQRIRRHLFRRDAAKGLAALDADAALPAPAALWLRAQFYRLQGRYAEALTTLDAVRKADPKFVDADAMRASLMLDLHRFDDLETSWFALLDRFPGHGPFHDDAAFDLLRAGRPARAKVVVNRALKRGIATPQQKRLNVLLVRALTGPSWNDLHEVKTRHYVVRSNIDRSICQEAAKVLEQAYLAYKAWLPKVPDATTRKFAVYLFAGEASYQRYARDATGSTAAGSAGLFSPWLKQLLIWNLPDREQMMRTVRHEAFHQYLDRVMPDPPRWFNEGYAEYFETASDAKGASWRTGRMRDDHLAALKRGGVKPLAKFFALDARQFMGQASLSYAQSWSIIYFMNESGPRYAPAARKLFQAFAEGKSADDAWTLALGRTTLTEFEKDYRAWLDPLVSKTAK